jgi:multiple sugar transport system permease protein
MIKKGGKSMRNRQSIQHFFIHLVLIIGTGVTILPFLWMVFTSFKTVGEAMAIPPTILPKAFNFDSYKNILDSLPFGRVYLNTIISTVATVIGQITFCTMAGYAFARLEFPGKNIIFIIILSVLMVPGQIFLVPQYMIILKMGLLDTIPALFLPNLFSAFGTFMMRQFFTSIPKELEEAAMLDGCNRFQTFGRIMVPLVKSGVVALVIFTAKFAWNDFMWPLIVNTSPKMMTLGPSLSTLQGQYTTNYPAQMAGAVMAVVPMVLLFFIFQKQFVEGVAHTGVKG